MAPSNIKFFSPEEIELLSSLFLKQYNKPPDSIPVELDLIIQRELGIDILPFFELQNRHGLEAYLALGCKTIYMDGYIMDQDKMERRYRFTLGEEIAHFILHKDLFKGVKTIDEYLVVVDNVSTKEYLRMQQDARRLAGAILMPAQIFRDKAVEQAIGSTEKGSNLKNIVIIPFLANVFNVSQTSASVRFDQLGLGNQFE